MKKQKIVIIVGARPNFIKVAPLINEFKKYKSYFDVVLVHTGQHYDFEMSKVFFHDLNILKPDVFLNVGSYSHAVQTAKIMIAVEKVLRKERPSLIIVVGDANSTLACALVASKMDIKIAHVEAGLRSFDRTMPEEINRMITDSLSSYLFVSERSGLSNLRQEGIDFQKVYFVGNVMIDTLFATMAKIDRSNILKRLSIAAGRYAVLTLHRPNNVDTRDSLKQVYNVLKIIASRLKLIYPVHPRTKKMMHFYNLSSKFKKLDGLVMIQPLGYIDFIKLIKESRFVITDSGGIQEETTALSVPCLTMRESTERPITVTEGTNYLVGKDKILKCTNDIFKGMVKKGKMPKFWDGNAAQRIIKILYKSIKTL